MLARAALIMVGIAIGLAAVLATRPGVPTTPGGVVTLTGPALNEAYVTLYQPAAAAYGVFAATGSGWVRVGTVARGATGTLTAGGAGAASMLRVGVSATHGGLVATHVGAVRRDGVAVGLLLDQVQQLAPNCEPGLRLVTQRALPYLTRLANPSARSATQALHRLLRALVTGHCTAVSGSLAALAEAASTLAQVPLVSG